MTNTVLNPLTGRTLWRPTSAFPNITDTEQPDPEKPNPVATADASTVMPRDLYPAVIAALQQDASTDYDILGEDGHYHTVNAAQHLQVDFTPDGVLFRPQVDDTWQWTMRLTGCGYGESIHPVAEAELVAEGNRFEYRRGNLTEWYINGPLGLEQGFTLHAPPNCQAAHQTLTVEIVCAGNLTPTLMDDGRGLAFTDAHHVTVLGYNHLHVTDATGYTLPTHMELVLSQSPEDYHIRITVDDTDAIYPITIDPVIYEQEIMTANDIVIFPDYGDVTSFGFPIAISGDTAFVGAPGADDGAKVDAGAVYVFKRNGANWPQHETQKLTLTNSGSRSWQGNALGSALAVDGDTLVVAGNDYDNNSRAVYIFRRQGTVWTQHETQKLMPSAGDNNAQGFGFKVAIDGNTLVVGSSTGLGKAYVFTRTSSTSPFQHVQTLTPSNGTETLFFGRAVAINGNTVVVGKPSANTDVAGAVYVYERSGGIWPEHETQKIVPSDSAIVDNFGFSIALTGDTLFVGGWGESTHPKIGAVYIFNRNGSSWSTLEAQALTASDGALGDGFGSAIALDANTLVVSRIGNNGDAAYIFALTESSWPAHETETLLPSSPSSNFGQSVAISGNTILVGNPAPGGSEWSIPGKVYVYSSAPNEPSNSGKSYWPLVWTGKPFLEKSVDVLHGEKSEEVSDMTLVCPGEQLTFTRSFRQNKQDVYDFMGLGWTHNHAMSLSLNGSVITVQLPNGGELVLQQISSSGGHTYYTANPGSTVTIDWDGTSYLLKAMDYSTATFNSAGQLITRVWPNGQAWTYNYVNSKLDTVTDTMGRGFAFVYKSNPGQFDDGQLWRVWDGISTTDLASQRYVEFGYQAASGSGALLSSVRDVRGNTWTYGYDGSNYLTQRLSPPVEYAVIPSLRATELGIPGKQATEPIILEQLDYTLSGTTVTGLVQSQGNGLLQTSYAFQPGGENITAETIVGTDLTTTHVFNNGVYGGVINPAGNFSSQAINPVYRNIQQVDANNSITRMDWSADGWLLEKTTDPVGNITQHFYRSDPAALNGALDYSLDAQGRKTQFHYEPDRFPTLRQPTEIIVTDGMAELSHQVFDYDALGNVKEQQVLGADGFMLQWITRTFYPAGSNGAGLVHEETLQRDPGTLDDNITTTYPYDRVGRLILTKRSPLFGECNMTYTFYDHAGNVLLSICNLNFSGLPSFSQEHYLEEAIHLYDPAHPDQNQMTAYVYDSLGRRIKEITNLGSQYQRTKLIAYDAMSRVVRTIDNYVPNLGTLSGSHVLFIADPYVHKREDFDDGPNNDQNLITDISYNLAGQMQNTIDPLDIKTGYGYYKDGHVSAYCERMSQ